MIKIAETLKNRLLFHRKLILNISVILAMIFLGGLVAFYHEINLLYIALCILSFFLIFKRPLIAIIMILSVLTIYQLLGYVPHFEIGTFNIFLEDVLAAIFIVAAILRLSMNKQSQIIIHSYSWKLFIIFSALAIVGILRGLPHYGQTTIVSAREHIYVIAATAYFCTFRFDKSKIKRAFPLFVIFAVVLLGIAYLRWLRILPALESSLKYKGTWLSERTLNRYGVFYLTFVLFAFIISTINKTTKKYILSWIAIISLIIAIILNQIRTMWIVVFMGFLILTLKYRLKFVKKIFVPLFLFLFILIFFSLFYQPKIISHFGNYLYKAASVFWKPRYTTLSWRIASNIAYLKQLSLKDYLLGVPFGTPISCMVEGRKWQIGIHNMFVEQIHKMGIFGLAAFTLLQISLIYRINKFIKIENNKIIKNSLVILWITLICYQIYFMAWTADLLYPIILGISMSVTAHYKYDKKVKF